MLLKLLPVILPSSQSRDTLRMSSVSKKTLPLVVSWRARSCKTSTTQCRNVYCFHFVLSNLTSLWYAINTKIMIWKHIQEKLTNIEAIHKNDTVSALYSSWDISPWLHEIMQQLSSEICYRSAWYHDGSMKRCQAGQLCVHTPHNIATTNHTWSS